MEADCVCICCKPTKYTVGLTTLVEALALGKPLICSRNPQIPVDVDREQCGIGVDYGDNRRLERAIRYIASHPEEAREMGRRGQQLARTTYNDATVAREVAEVLHATLRRR
jgi:glycosyltransferase involved in cell wall biosynthesis